MTKLGNKKIFENYIFDRLENKIERRKKDEIVVLNSFDNFVIKHTKNPKTKIFNMLKTIIDDDEVIGVFQKYVDHTSRE